MNAIKCPFCSEDDFDLIGLKGHLLEFCEVFVKTPTPEEEYLKHDPKVLSPFARMLGYKPNDKNA